MNKNWSVLDLNIKGLEKVKEHLEHQAEDQAYEALQEYFTKRKQLGFLNDASEVIAEIEKSSLDSILHNANRLLKNTFVYDKPWDMEKCFEPITFTDKINWHHVYNNDPEWMFMINRQNFLMDLVLAYLMTKKEAYLKQYLFLMEDWQQQEPTYEGNENASWRTIDTGIRLKNWVKQLELLLPLGVLPGEFILNTLASIEKQMHYLLDVFDFNPYLVQSNWRVLEFHGAFIAATYFPEIVNSSSFQQRGKANLELVLPYQVTEDGIHWEQSFMYHHEVLLNCLEAFQVAKRNKLTFSNEFREILVNMLHASSHIIAPDYTQPSYGDSDVEDMRHILTLSALVLEPKTLNSFGLLAESDFDLLVDYGTDAKKHLAKLKKQLTVDNTLDFALEDAGIYALRDGWQTDSNMLLFTNGFLGGGHGHNDLLNLDLYLNGEAVLVDSGRFTYKEGFPKRFFFKESKQHNTFMMDDKEYTTQTGAWSNGIVANEVKRLAKVNQEIAFLQGMHLGYGPEAVLNRKVIYLKEDNLFLVADESFASGKHTYQQHFHFPTPQVTTDEKAAYYQTKTNQVAFYPLDNQTITIEDTEISPSYNQVIDTKKVTFHSEQTGKAHFNFAIVDKTKGDVLIHEVPVENMNHKVISNEFVSAYDITTKKNKYLVVISHFEVEKDSRKVYMVNGIPMFGRTVVCKQVDGNFKPIVLEY